MTQAITDFKLAAADLALVVVDIQDKIAGAMPEKVLAQVIHNTNILLATAAEFSIPVVVAEQNRRALGPTLPGVNLPAEHSLVEKMSFSYFGEPAFVQALNNTGRGSVILCGEETHICIYQIALDLLEEGRKVFIAADAVCSRAKLNWMCALESMRQAGAVVVSTETLVYQLLERAGNDRFKRIAPLVK